MQGLFDDVIDIHQSTDSRLSSTATIVQSPQFEDAAVKTKLRNSHAPRREEQIVMAPLKPYGDLRFDFSTSDICKQLFPKLGYVLNERGKIIVPTSLESQLFLHGNRDLLEFNVINKTIILWGSTVVRYSKIIEIIYPSRMPDKDNLSFVKSHEDIIWI